MRNKRLDSGEVRKIAMALLDVEVSTIHDAPSPKMRGKLLTYSALHRSAESNTLAVRISVDQRTEVMAADLVVCRLRREPINPAAASQIRL
jgi:hypothetical protein